jgi:hypothetical protein
VCVCVCVCVCVTVSLILPSRGGANCALLTSHVTGRTLDNCYSFIVLWTCNNRYGKNSCQLFLPEETERLGMLSKVI